MSYAVPWRPLGATTAPPAPAPPPPSTARKVASVYIAGSLMTFAIAGLLVVARRPIAAAAVILVSPFPCPPGVPC